MGSAGVVQDPYSEVKKHGALGLAPGLMKGLVGLVMKPSVGLAYEVSNDTSNVRKLMKCASCASFCPRPSARVVCVGTRTLPRPEPHTYAPAEQQLCPLHTGADTNITTRGALGDSFVCVCHPIFLFSCFHLW